MDLLLTASMPWPTILYTILLDEVMIVTGLVGALVQSSYKVRLLSLAVALGDLKRFLVGLLRLWLRRFHLGRFHSDLYRSPICRRCRHRCAESLHNMR